MEGTKVDKRRMEAAHARDERRQNAERMTTASRRWTVADIAARNEASGGHYFDRGTLRFFGQTRGDFRVYQGGGRVFVFAATHKGWDSPGLSSCGEFNPETGRVDALRHPSEIGLQWTREKLKAYVADLRKPETVTA